MQVEELLRDIQALMSKGERAEPQRQLLELMNQMGADALYEWRPDLDRIIRTFQRKRRRELERCLEDGIEAKSGGESLTNSPNKVADADLVVAQSDMAISTRFLDAFRSDLDVLQQHHIFQWSTFYRDCFDERFDQLLATANLAPEESASDISALLSEHTLSVFSKGYEYACGTQGQDHAISKSLAGLTQFLALLLEFYSQRTSLVSSLHSTAGLRTLFSAATSGVLAGYSKVRFGRQSGAAILPKFQRQWIHYLAFLTPGDARRVAECIDSDILQESLCATVLPLLETLQKFFRRHDTAGDYWPLPSVGHFAWNQRRLDISFRPPRSAAVQRLLQLCAFLDEAFVSIEDLEESLSRNAVLVIAPLKPDVNKIVAERVHLKSIVVRAEVAAERAESAPRVLTRTTVQAYKVLDNSLYELRSKLKSNSPITYNFAREFPLHHPEQASHYRVQRSSVRDLLRTFERRNGVRLWCSVRRSGKTMACLNMETTSGESKTIPQTCGVSTNNPSAQDANAFYQGVRDAIELDRMISNTFVNELVAACAQIDISDRRGVLIIDEYETLFGLLKNAVLGNDGARYRTVQPILDQLVEFSRENLLVFLGQQPNAHFILMDQNQLAPYVTQDSFPLFEHVAGAATGEFKELVNKILTDRIECAAGFLDQLFEETAGHPFLTASVLVEFVDWLIELQRPQHGLQVRENDFLEFLENRLCPDRMLLSKEYEFFREAASSALSAQGHHDNPWLYSVYWVVRLLAQENSENQSVARKDFKDIVERVPIPVGKNPVDSSEILQTAAHSNFLAFNDHEVRVKVRTLGRIASAVQPKVG